MPKPPKVENLARENDVKNTKSPFIFISHDTRDADLAEAFGKLLTSVSAGLLKVFRSSDKKGTQGIEYGVEWYPKIMQNLNSASDVVCLLTENSINRPWILYEAGVAKGRLNTPVYGIVLGIPFNNANTGPFAQFQNCDDADDSLTKLVVQLLRRIPDASPDQEVVLAQVKVFKEKIKKCLVVMPKEVKEEKFAAKGEEAATTQKLFEEIKIMFQDLPTRISIRSPDKFPLERNVRMLTEFADYMTGHHNPLSILVIAAIYKDLPWIYDPITRFYAAIRKHNPRTAIDAFEEFRKAVHLTADGPLLEVNGITHSMINRSEDILERFIRMPPEVDHFNSDMPDEIKGKNP